jgi:hypothetical protein
MSLVNYHAFPVTRGQATRMPTPPFGAFAGMREREFGGFVPPPFD